MTQGEHARPFLTFHVGQAGVQIGHAIWELLCLEHNILPSGSGKLECPSNGFYDAMFLKNASGHFMPRSIFVDTDPTCINEVRVGPYRDLFGASQLLSDHNDASFNYMRGRHGFSDRLVPDTVERFRWLMEKTDITPATFLIHGISGGTGSGFAVSCMEELKNDLGSKLQVLELNVSSGRSGLQSSCELVNSVLYQYESKDFTDVSFSVTNSAMYNVCRSGLNMSTATYAHVNRMLAMCFSNLTSMERFPGTVPCSISSICSNVLPFKQLKHPVLACAPFTTADMAGKERLNAIGVTSAVMDPDGQLADIDLRQGKHMAGVLLYRGAAKTSDIDQALASLRAKSNSKVEFVDWAPARFKTGLIELPPLAVPSSGIGGTSLSVTLISNHTAISSLFRGQSEAVKKLSSGNFFLHNYEGQGVSVSGPSGHNSGIRDLLKEACEHMDGVAGVYESDLPPDQSLAALNQQKRPSERADVQPKGGKSSNRPGGEEAAYESSDGVKAQYGKTTPSSEREKSVVEENVVASVSDRQHASLVRQQVAYDSLQAMEHEEANVGSSEYKQMESDNVRLADSKQPEWENGGETLHEGYQQKHTDTSAPAATTELATPYTHQQGSLTPTSTEDSTVTHGHQDDTHTHSAQATTSEATPGVVNNGTTTGKPKSGKKCSKCCEEGGKCGTCCKKGGCKKDGTCCKKDGNKKDGNKKDGNKKDGNKKDGSKKDGKCCRKRSSERSGMQPENKRGQSECCKKRSTKGTPMARYPVNDRSQSQSQNHANSVTRYPTESSSAAADAESCRSSNCVDLEGYLYKQRKGVASNVRTHQLRQSLRDTVSSSASTPSANSVADIQEIIQSCLPGPGAVSSTICSVRQIIQKYNSMFSKDANDAESSTAWSLN